MIKKRGKMRRGMVVFANALPAIGEFAAGLWRSDSGKKWLIPLVVFLCVTGLLLILGLQPLREALPEPRRDS